MANDGVRSGGASPSQDRDLCEQTVATPLGLLRILASGAGLVRVLLPSQVEDVVGQRARPVAARRPRPSGLPGAVAGDAADFAEQAGQQLQEYFDRSRRTFDLPLDPDRASAFTCTVGDALAAIPYGTTKSYAEVAVAVGQPAAVRAVGSACGRNPLPIILPCHRVLRADGSLGGYSGGLEVKQALLTLEGVDVRLGVG